MHLGSLAVAHRLDHVRVAGPSRLAIGLGWPRRMVRVGMVEAQNFPTCRPRIPLGLEEIARLDQKTPPPLLRRMVAAGLLGRKSGRGFYDWGMNPPAPVELGL